MAGCINLPLRWCFKLTCVLLVDGSLYQIQLMLLCLVSSKCGPGMGDNMLPAVILGKHDLAQLELLWTIKVIV